jgi:hypothetical protein
LTPLPLSCDSSRVLDGYFRPSAPIVLVVYFVLVWISCGGDDEGRDGAASEPTESAAPTPSRAWTLSSEDLCSLLTAEEVSGTLAITVQAEASSFDGCLYGAAELLARLTESAFSGAEYSSFVSALGLRSIELGDGAVMATNADERAIGAWFKTGGRALEILFTTGVDTDKCAELMAAARAEL